MTAHSSRPGRRPRLTRQQISISTQNVRRQRTKVVTLKPFTYLSFAQWRCGAAPSFSLTSSAPVEYVPLFELASDPHRGQDTGGDVQGADIFSFRRNAGPACDSLVNARLSAHSQQVRVITSRRVPVEHLAYVISNAYWSRSFRHLFSDSAAAPRQFRARVAISSTIRELHIELPRGWVFAKVPNETPTQQTLGPFSFALLQNNWNSLAPAVLHESVAQGYSIDARDTARPTHRVLPLTLHALVATDGARGFELVPLTDIRSGSIALNIPMFATRG